MFRLQHSLSLIPTPSPSPENNIKMFSKRKVSVKGVVEAQFEPVREAFQENFTNGEEVSAQLSVVQDGKVVVDLWCSVEDQDYTGDSLQQIWSSTKNLTALAVAMLVDRLDSGLPESVECADGSCWSGRFSATLTGSVSTGPSLVLSGITSLTSPWRTS